MSNTFSETLSHVFEKVRLSSDRILNRLSRFALSIMNFAARLLQLFCVTLLYFSAVMVSVVSASGGWGGQFTVSASVGCPCRFPREVIDHVHVCAYLNVWLLGVTPS